MALLVGNGFHLTNALGVAGVAAEGTVLTAGDIGQVASIQTDGTLAGGNGAMNAGDSFIVDTDDDGDFSDEAATTQIDNDRYTGSTVTFVDGSTTNVTLELITLSDGTQAILVNDGGAGNINAGADQIQSITLGTFNNVFVNRYNQGNFNNTITNTVTCFMEETLIRTPNGERMIGTLVAGDEVVTSQGGVQKIVWIGKRRLSSAQLVASPHLKPVCISPGALGHGIPRTDLLVSPQHRILIASKIAQRMFGHNEIFVPAIKLIEADGIAQVSSVAPITYVHILFEKHQVIFANGAPAESLYTGPEALSAMSEQARKEIFEIFPELEVSGQAASLAHPAVKKQKLVSKLLQRHKQNRKKLVQMGNAHGSA